MDTQVAKVPDTPLANRVVHVPVSLLLDPGQTAAMKVVWIALRLDPQAGPAQLMARTGLSRHSVLDGQRRVLAGGLPTSGPRIKLPAALLAERAVGARGKVLYGLLQTTANFKGQGGQFTYPALSTLTGLGPNTLKRAVAELAEAGWIQVSQANRLSPIRFTLSTPARTRNRVEVEAAERRLKRAKFGGEAIMQEYLSLLIDSDQFTDNARPGFLINPLTGERLELDRFYPPRVAFEFHGAQHYRGTERFTQTEAEAQHVRDLLKAGICLYRGVHLVLIHAEELSLHGMMKKIGQSMPLRNLEGQEPLIDLLEEASMAYRAAAARTPGQSATPAGWAARAEAGSRRG